MGGPAAEVCPSCGASKSVSGSMGQVEGVEVRDFTPHRTRAGGGLPVVAAGFRACTSCGHLWGAVDAGELREYIRSRGDGLAREQLDDFDLGPLRGLPETDLAREVAAKVAEINALVCASRTSAATRRLRDLAGVTWDRAIELTRKWPGLPREEKLELFGWAAKKSGPADEFS